MNTPKDFDGGRFHLALIETGRVDKLNDIDTLLGVSDESECWSEEFLRSAVAKAKKSVIRKVMRDGYQDEDGVKHECFRVEEFDADADELREGYKQLTFFSIDNYEYVIRDTMMKISRDEAKIARLCKLFRKKFGKKKLKEIQLRLGLDKYAGSEPSPAA